MEQKKQFGVIFFLIDRERIEKVEHFYRKLRYSQMHSNPGATLKIPKQSYNNGNFVKNFNIKGKIDKVLSKFFKL